MTHELEFSLRQGSKRKRQVVLFVQNFEDNLNSSVCNEPFLLASSPESFLSRSFKTRHASTPVWRLCLHFCNMAFTLTPPTPPPRPACPVPKDPHFFLIFLLPAQLSASSTSSSFFLSFLSSLLVKGVCYHQNGCFFGKSPNSLYPHPNSLILEFFIALCLLLCPHHKSSFMSSSSSSLFSLLILFLSSYLPPRRMTHPQSPSPYSPFASPTLSLSFTPVLSSSSYSLVLLSLFSTLVLCSSLTPLFFLSSFVIFIGPRYTWGPIYGSKCLKLTNFGFLN